VNSGVKSSKRRCFCSGMLHDDDDDDDDDGRIVPLQNDILAPGYAVGTGVCLMFPAAPVESTAMVGGVMVLCRESARRLVATNLVRDL